MRWSATCRALVSSAAIGSSRLAVPTALRFAVVLRGLAGGDEHGRWLLTPSSDVWASSRRYRPGTLVLETDLETSDGAVRIIDLMPRRASGPPRFIRIVEGLRGQVPMRMELDLRPDYASIVPWLEPAPDGMTATAARSRGSRAASPTWAPGSGRRLPGRSSSRTSPPEHGRTRWRWPFSPWPPESVSLRRSSFRRIPRGGLRRPPSRPRPLWLRCLLRTPHCRWIARRLGC